MVARHNVACSLLFSWSLIWQTLSARSARHFDMVRVMAVLSVSMTLHEITAIILKKDAPIEIISSHKCIMNMAESYNGSTALS